MALFVHRNDIVAAIAPDGSAITEETKRKENEKPAPQQN